MSSGRDGMDDESEEGADFVFDLEDGEVKSNLEEDEGEEDDDVDMDEGIEEEEENTTEAVGCSTKVDSRAVQLEPQFEIADYETLAARKRKAIVESYGGDASKKARRDLWGVSQDKLMEIWNFGRCRRRKRKEEKKRGRRKGSKKKRNPEFSKLLGDATILYVHDRHAEAIRKLHEVIRLAGDVPEAYHTLALVHDALGNTKVVTEIYTIVAALSRGDSSVWKLLFNRHLCRGHIERAIKCLYKAVASDPSDITLRVRLAMFYEEHADYPTAGRMYEQIVKNFPDHSDTVDALMKAAEKISWRGRTLSSLVIKRIFRERIERRLRRLKERERSRSKKNQSGIDGKVDLNWIAVEQAHS